LSIEVGFGGHLILLPAKTNSLDLAMFSSRKQIESLTCQFKFKKAGLKLTS